MKYTKYKKKALRMWVGWQSADSAKSWWHDAEMSWRARWLVWQSLICSRWHGYQLWQNWKQDKVSTDHWHRCEILKCIHWYTDMKGVVPEYCTLDAETYGNTATQACKPKFYKTKPVILKRNTNKHRMPESVFRCKHWTPYSDDTCRNLNLKIAS